MTLNLVSEPQGASPSASSLSSGPVLVPSQLPTHVPTPLGTAPPFRRPGPRLLTLDSGPSYDRLAGCPALSSGDQAACMEKDACVSSSGASRSDRGPEVLSAWRLSSRHGSDGPAVRPGGTGLSPAGSTLRWLQRVPDSFLSGPAVHPAQSRWGDSTFQKPHLP